MARTSSVPRLLVLFAVLVLGAAACGGGGDDAEPEPAAAETPEPEPEAEEPEPPSGPPDVTLKLTNKGVTFTPEKLKAPAGKVAKLVYKNGSDFPHNVFVKAGTSTTDPTIGSISTTTTGGSVLFDVPEDAGRYLFYCGLHPTMTGSLVVK